MIHFVWPWVFFLLPLPILVRFILPRAVNANDAALRVPYLRDFALGPLAHKKQGFRAIPLILFTLAWLCLLLAASRPQWIGSAVQLPVSGRDIMLAVDLSGSMQQPFSYGFNSISKITATKKVAGQFIDQRVGDRIGLILFGTNAYVQAPLTFDRATVKELLDQAVPGLAGSATAIGDAIGLAVKRLDHTGNKNRVLILMTDGVNNAGELSPERAAKIAAIKHLKIYTIGIGPPGTNELDETTLKKIASITGGRYFRAQDPRQLKEIYQYIDKLEPVVRDTRSYRPTWALFYWPLGAALGFAGLLGLLRQKDLA